MARLPYAGGRNGMGTTAVENDFLDQVEEAHGAGDNALADGIAGKGPIQPLPAMIAANERKMIRDSQAMPPEKTVRDEIAMSMANTGIGSMPRNYMPPIGMAGNPQMQPPMQQMAEGGRVMRGYQQGTGPSALDYLDPIEMGLSSEELYDLVYSGTGSAPAAFAAEVGYDIARPDAIDAALAAGALATGTAAAYPAGVLAAGKRVLKAPYSMYKTARRHMPESGVILDPLRGGLGRARSAFNQIGTTNRFGDVLPASFRDYLDLGGRRSTIKGRINRGEASPIERAQLALHNLSRRPQNTQRGVSKGFDSPPSPEEAFQTLGAPALRGLARGVPVAAGTYAAGSMLRSDPTSPDMVGGGMSVVPTEERASLLQSPLGNTYEDLEKRIQEREQQPDPLTIGDPAPSRAPTAPPPPAPTAQPAAPSVAPGMSPYEEYLQNLYSMDNVYAQKLEDAKRRSNAAVMLQIASNMFKRGTSPFEGTSQAAQRASAGQAALEQEREARRNQSALAEQRGFRGLQTAMADDFLRARELESQDRFRRGSLRLQEQTLPIKVMQAVAQDSYYQGLLGAKGEERRLRQFRDVVDDLIRSGAYGSMEDMDDVEISKLIRDAKRIVKASFPESEGSDSDNRNRLPDVA